MQTHDFHSMTLSQPRFLNHFVGPFARVFTNALPTVTCTPIRLLIMQSFASVSPPFSLCVRVSSWLQILLVATTSTPLASYISFHLPPPSWLIPFPQLYPSLLHLYAFPSLRSTLSEMAYIKKFLPSFSFT